MSLENVQNIENELLTFIAREVVQEGVGRDESLISSGKVDSLGLIQILGFIEETYGMSLLSSAEPKDFESVASLAAAVSRARGQA
jgi:acyl carrier protein